MQAVFFIDVLPAARRNKAGQRIDADGSGHARLDADGEGSEHPQRRQRDLDPAARKSDGEARHAVGLDDRLGAILRGPSLDRREYAAMRHARGGGRQQRFVAVEDERSARTQAVDDGHFLQTDALAAAESLNMRGADVGHDGDVGRGGLGQRRDLARLAHPDFQHAGACVLGDAQHRQRQADPAVHIPNRRIGGTIGGQHERRHILGGRFSDAAGDTDAFHVPQPFAPVSAGQTRQRFADVVDQYGVAHEQRPVAHKRRAARVENRADVQAAVRPLAPDRRKQRSFGFQRLAAVRADIAQDERAVAVGMQDAAGKARRLAECDKHENRFFPKIVFIRSIRYR